MKTANFILHRINYLGYYLPLIAELSKTNIKTNIFLDKSSKEFIDPYYPKHLQEILKYSKKYNYKVFPVSETNFQEQDGRNDGNTPVYFLAEGNIVGISNKDKGPYWLNWLSPQTVKISLVVNFEFMIFGEKYHHYIDYIIFPSIKYIQYYQLDKIIPSKKMLVLGSPKYDDKYPLMSKEIIYGKYDLPETEKYILIIFPKDPKKHKKQNTIYPTFDNLLKLYKIIREKGYKIIVKNRFQDTLFREQSTSNDLTKINPKIIEQLRGDYYFEDMDHYPTNSMELISIAEMGVFFSSSISEEFVYLKKPYLDLKVDLNKDRFPFYNKHNHSIILPYQAIFSQDNSTLNSLIGQSIDYLIKANEWEFEERIDLVESSSNCSNKIIQKFLV